MIGSPHKKDLNSHLPVRSSPNCHSKMASSRTSSRSCSPTIGDRYASLAATPSPPSSGTGSHNPVRPVSMDRLPEESGRSRGGLQNLAGSGFHMPPEVLGQVESPSKEALTQQSTPPRKSHLADLNIRARKRSQLAVKATQSQAASAIAAQYASTPRNTASKVAVESSMLTLLTYGGVEVIFANAAPGILTGVCSRTHLLFQTLTLASDTPVVSITSNSDSGLLVVAHENGLIQTYRPVPTNPGEPQSTKGENNHFHTPPDTPFIAPTAFGKYRWIDCLTIDAGEYFYQPGETVKFLDRRNATPGHLVDLSTSTDHKLSVVHKNQLAVFDLSISQNANSDPVSPRTAGATGRLLWTTLFPSDVVTAKISGDGQCVAVVLANPEEDGSFGCRTFIHDMDDGSASTALSRPALVRNPSVGVVYKQGPFLRHASPVTRISFRGLGRNTSSTSETDEQGNDLLLTYCEDDSTVRIFNQNSWKQLMMWVTPPNTRADWIRGSSAFCLGDLEAHRKSKGSKALSRRSSGASVSDLSSGGPISAGLRSARTLGTGTPTTAAGAWIAEITFRGAFPALRLSRLSYMKRGNDDSQPAHFESVAAILPAGSIVAGSVLNSDDMGLSVQGIWPAWNPWLSEPTGDHSSDTLRGSAMQFLGLSSVPPPHFQHFGDSYLGGTHSPPSELRIAASHPTTGNLVLMEFPLWGDDDFGAMELGSPIRSVLSLSGAHVSRNDVFVGKLPASASTAYDSSRLQAQIGPEKRTISLLWRKQGSHSLYSPEYTKDEPLLPKPIHELASPPSPQLLHDMSILPVPLALPPLRLPRGAKFADTEEIISIKWWPDDSFDGPPLLLAVTSTAKFVLFEIPPPRSAREPPMPNFDPFNGSSNGSIDGEDTGSELEDDTVVTRQEYEVSVTPHPDFGLGLRLESLMDGLPAIAGSFKKHPLNGGMLPAEKTGMIVLGDEVLSVNGVSLENMTFDDIIATVRHVGAETGPGQPLNLRFRPAAHDRSRRNSAVLAESFSVRPHESAPSGEVAFATQRSSGKLADIHNNESGAIGGKQSEEGSFARLLTENSSEGQQEFGRIIAVLQQAIPSVKCANLSRRLLVAPWGNGVGAPNPSKLRGAAFVVLGEANKLYVKRLELPLDTEASKATIQDLGSYDIQCDGKECPPSVSSIQSIPSCGGSCRSVLVADNTGLVKLVVVEVSMNLSSNQLQASFRQYRMFDLGKDSLHFKIEPASVFHIATAETAEDSNFKSTVRIWSAYPDPSCRIMKSELAVQDEFLGHDYVFSDLEVVPSDNSSSKVVDFAFLKLGQLESFPTIIICLSSEALVYQRRAGKSKWMPVLRIMFPWVPSSTPRDPPRYTINSGDPTDFFPHLFPMIQSILPSYDECNYLISDWNPECLLAHLCLDKRGSKVALTNSIRQTLLWLADRLEDASDEVTPPAHSPLLVAALDSVGGASISDSSRGDSQNTSANIQSAWILNGRGSIPVEQQEKRKLERLLDALGRRKNFTPRNNLLGRSAEFKLAMAQMSNSADTSKEDQQSTPLPFVLKSMSPPEIRVLWVMTNMVLNAPIYETLDTQGELALSVFAIHRSLVSSPKDNAVSSQHSSTSLYNMSNVSSYFARNKSSAEVHDKSKLPEQCASAGCVAALLSDYQGVLVERLRQPGMKFDWPTVRELRIPFWLRSDDKLRQISEEVGQNLYRESRDILKAAIFFLAAGKQRTLRNLAAADRSDSGQKFFKFLTSFDFSSERGKSAAEKNAFSLLRKNKYDCAAAFFLLSEPPLLKSAVETIATKMNDIDLAFMVARLVGTASLSGGQGVAGIGNGGLSFGGVMGGGGGYASYSVADTEMQKDAESFRKWKAVLCPCGKDLLLDRALPDSYNDSMFCALLLLWLGRSDEAWHWMSGFVECPSGVLPNFSTHGNISRLKESSPNAKKSQDATMTMTSSFINLVSSPYILKTIGAAKRTRIASTLFISTALCRIGIELPTLKLLEQITESDFLEDTLDVNGEENNLEEQVSRERQSDTASSIFAGFDTPLQVPSSNPPAASAATSSIFDSYVAAPTPKFQPIVNEISSSIFDSYDAPRKPEVAQRPETSTVSSIFDAYEAPPRPKVPAAPANEMTSSIFDSFNPPADTKVPQASDGRAASSIFDSFDVPPHNQTSLKSAKNVSSSIFDSYDPPPKPHPTQNAPATSSDTFEKRPASSIAADVTPKAETHPTEEAKSLRNTPAIWGEWHKQLLVQVAARRLVREVGSLGVRLHMDAFLPSLTPSRRKDDPLFPSSACQILQFHSDGDKLLDSVRRCVQKISTDCGIDEMLLVDKSLQLLEAPYLYHRVSFAVLLNLAVNRVDLAEDVVRGAAHSLLEKCVFCAFSNDTITCNKLSVTHSSSLNLRRLAAHLCWQVELCLWLHRGSALPLSGLALNEAICSVRAGILLAGWNRNFEVLETLIRQPPDCQVNEDLGRQLWASLKLISSASGSEKKTSGTNSGGWEFLVDCRRIEATEMLRHRSTGCFIIRPHPEDHGVFTLSFKTNLVPTGGSEIPDEAKGEPDNNDKKEQKSSSTSRPIKPDDVVQHAIIRLSDSGFRCGSFGPFATLMKLLEAVSSSLPFNLRFDKPPTEGVIKDEGSKPSPNSAFFRKLSLSEGTETVTHRMILSDSEKLDVASVHLGESKALGETHDSLFDEKAREHHDRKSRFGLFLELLILSEFRKQLCSVAAAKYDCRSWGEADEVDSVGSISDENDMGPEQEYAVAARILRPLLTWCRVVEIGIVDEIAPHQKHVAPVTALLPVALNASDDAIELSTTETSAGADGGDAVIRRMIQPGSGVGFRTLKLGDTTESAMLVLFSKREAADWFISNGVEKSEDCAVKRLDMMEKSRVIEPVDFKALLPKGHKTSKQEDGDEDALASQEKLTKGVRYRLVDPWEVEPLESREAETEGACLGRNKFLAFGLGRVAASCEDLFRSVGGQHLLELWAAGKGGVVLTKAIATVQPPWERSSGGDLLLRDGDVAEPDAFNNSIRQHLYRNSLFRRLGLPQRFLALIQVELLDLKNLTSPGGSLSLTVYSLLRLKRPRSTAPLTTKARTLDSIATPPIKLGKATGPNAPASWGSLVRFRFPLPEYTAADGKSYDSDREALFKGPPSVLQVSVYERKFMSDTLLGSADVKLEGLCSGGQLEEWVPLRTESHGINWFARIRLTLRFELMCLSSDAVESEELVPSVGLRRIQQLIAFGGMEEDLRKSGSKPDLLSYLESMVY